MTMQAVVYKSTGSWYTVKDDDGNHWNARIKGVFKIDEEINSTNPIAVGDKVEMELENEGEKSVIITKIHDRRNYINRQSPRSKYQHHIIAANLDQSLLIATLKDPKTSQGFIDRFLIACEMYHVPAILVFNKFDLYRKKEQEQFKSLSEMYGSIGYKVMSMSMKEHHGVEPIRELLQNKITLVSGHSGVGKSSFVNSLLPGADIRVKDVSGWSGKGMHTTTFAEMYDLPSGGAIIDTPGMREFGLVGLSRQELSGYFPEMRARLNDCQYNNCLHINEPDCAIKEAVVNGEIDEARFVSYYNILESIDAQRW
jgi:ribosome biogenesis GTPase